MDNSKNILLSTAYFPPVQYFSKFLQFENVYIEQHENFTKQTYRNRILPSKPLGTAAKFWQPMAPFH